VGYILHVVPDSINNTRKIFIGSTKDVLGRSEYFDARPHCVRQFVSVGRSDDEVLAMLGDADLRECRAVLFEYEMYVRSLAFLKQNYPGIGRLVRAHNANLPHLVDQFHGKLRMIEDRRETDLARATSAIHLALARFRLDGQCAELADAILPICHWEADHYWGQLTAAEKVVTVPYFVPRPFVEQIPSRPRRNVCLFAMGTGSSMAALLYDAGRNAVELVNALPADVAAEWDFQITGNLKPPDVLGALGRLKPTGLVASPLPLLAEARAVAIPSDLGMGFKTKILEAILAGCWVLVTEEVHARLPEAVRPWCLLLDPRSPARFAETLHQCAGPPPSGDPNARLRDEAFRGLDRVLAVGSPISAEYIGPPVTPRSEPPRAPDVTPTGRPWPAGPGAGEGHRASSPLPPNGDTARVGAFAALTAIGAFRRVEPSVWSADRGAASFGEGRIIYHACLKPVLVSKRLIASSPAVFEYGVGMGRILRSLSEDGLTCGGVDRSPALLDHCRRFVPRASTLGLMDESGTCDFPSEWADFAYSFSAIQHIAKTSRIDTAISEMVRVLRPGGYVRLQFRSASGQRPHAPLLKRELLYNLEDRTVVLHLRPLRPGQPALSRIRLPWLGLRQHSEREGIPLSIGHLLRVLRKHGVEPLSVEPDRRKKGDLFWVTGKKRR
jgi:SAM-dependent methyltransferase